MSKEFDAKKDLNLSDDVLSENAIKGEISIEMLTFRQIERTAQSALQDETLFAANVRVLMTFLPASKREDILSRSDEYLSVETHWVFKQCCNVNMGTIEHPICGSPYKQTNEVQDWHKLFELCMNALEDLGLIWKRENNTVETGGLEDRDVKTKPTPVFVNQMNPESNPLPQQLEKRLPTCQVSGEVVKIGEGMHYKGKLIKRSNLEKAKLAWADVEKGFKLY